MNVYGYQEVEPEYLAVMAAKARIYQVQPGTDQYGKVTYADTPVEIPMYARLKRESLPTPTGETRVVDGKLFLGYIVPWLTAADRLEVPDLAAPTGWKETLIGAVELHYGPTGPHHQEIWFGQMGVSTRSQS